MDQISTNKIEIVYLVESKLGSKFGNGEKILFGKEGGVQLGLLFGDDEGRPLGSERGKNDSTEEGKLVGS